ncbi:MAG: dihydropteroate synthase, partial [Planctomycetota bacterium]
TNPPADATRVVVPGSCGGDLTPIEQATGLPVDRGPRDLRDLPRHFGAEPPPSDYGAYRIEIIAEINHCPRLTLPDIVAQAERLARDGADVIDIGCEPGGGWSGVADAVRALRDLGLRVSVDSLETGEIAAAAAAGAELVLSVNASNRDAAADWGCEVIAIPDDPKSLAGLDETVDTLARRGVPLRIDPILEPIGFGFAGSLARYHATRERYPDAAMMMGIGNLTEMTSVDSAGVNTLLLGFCEELAIGSVLTTQVIPWAAGSVRECDVARRLVHHAVRESTVPKHLDDRLVLLRDAAVSRRTVAELDELAESIRDYNYRLFVGDDALHLVGMGQRISSRDPFVIAQRLIDALDADERSRPLDPSHAFYLGFELAKAATALTLGKHYEQDEPLDWGFLTQTEESHYLQRKRRTMPARGPADGPANGPAEGEGAP